MKFGPASPADAVGGVPVAVVRPTPSAAQEPGYTLKQRTQTATLSSAIMPTYRRLRVDVNLAEGGLRTPVRRRITALNPPP